MKKVFTPEVKLFGKPGDGQVEKTISTDQLGRVKWKGTSWPARFYQNEGQANIFPGNPVKVIGRQSIILLVVPEN